MVVIKHKYGARSHQHISRKGVTSWWGREESWGEGGRWGEAGASPDAPSLDVVIVS